LGGVRRVVVLMTDSTSVAIAVALC